MGTGGSGTIDSTKMRSDLPLLFHSGACRWCLISTVPENESIYHESWENKLSLTNILYVKVHIHGRCFYGHVSAGLFNSCSTKLYVVLCSCFLRKSKWFIQILLVICEKCKIQLESNFLNGSNTSSACSLGIWHSLFTFYNVAQILAHI